MAHQYIAQFTQSGLLKLTECRIGGTFIMKDHVARVRLVRWPGMTISALNQAIIPRDSGTRNPARWVL